MHRLRRVHKRLLKGHTALGEGIKINTRKIDRLSTGAVLGLTLVLLLGAPPEASAHTRITTDVNWGKNIREILRNKCMTCHHPGALGPDYVDLTVYGTDTEPGARAWAQAILEEVLSERMPPWQADRRFSAFENERRLSTEEIALIRAWVEGGAPQGPIRDLPVPPEFERPDWIFGPPDLVLSPPEDHVIPEEQIHDTVSFTFPTDLDEDTYITGYEFMPGNPRSIHSMTAYIHDPEAASILSIEMEVTEAYDPLADDDGPVKTRMRSMPRGPHFLGQWVRGDLPVLLPDSAGRLLRKGSTIELHILYERPEYAEPDELHDRSQLGLFFANQDAEIDFLVESTRIANDSFVVKANAAKQEVRALQTIRENAHLIGINPHLGPLATDLEVRATYPDGKSATLLWIPRYETRWASSFHFEKPVAAPAETQIELIAHYDNTEDNWNNPNDPPQDVSAGPNPEDERLYAMLDYMLDDHLYIQPAFEPTATVDTAPAEPGMAFPGGVIPTRATQPDGTDQNPFNNLPELVNANIHWCPMRGGFCSLQDYHGPGTCDECGMDLKPKSTFFEGKAPAPESADWALTREGGAATYWCPNRAQAGHELNDYTSGGVCEVCGAALAHRSRFEAVHSYTCLTQTCARHKDVFFGPGLCPECGQPVAGMGHMDHNPVHGGWQFFMVDNLFHHLEGTLPSPGEFRMYFYDDWKKPLDPRNFKGSLFIEHENEASGEVTEEPFPFGIEKQGNAYFTARLPEELPIAFYAKVWFAGEEKRYDFEFDALTVEPPEDAPRMPVLLHDDSDYVPIDVPGALEDIVRLVLEQDAALTQHIANDQWLAFHAPAFDTRHLVAALAEKQQGLSARQRGQLKKATALINRGANALENAGHAADTARARRAYQTYAEGIALIKTIYGGALP